MCSPVSLLVVVRTLILLSFFRPLSREANASGVEEFSNYIGDWTIRLCSSRVRGNISMDSITM